MEALIFILISLISVSQSQLNCNGIEVIDYNVDINDISYEITSALPAGVCFGSRLMGAEENDQVIESSGILQCVGDKMYIKQYPDAVCKEPVSSTTLASNIYDPKQYNIVCDKVNCKYVKVRMLTDTVDNNNCKPLSEVYTTAYWVQAVYIDNYCIKTSDYSAKAICVGEGVDQEAEYTIYSDDQVCGASTTVVNYDNGCQFHVECGTANSMCSGSDCTDPNTGGQGGVCNINANSFRLIYDNTQFRFEGECLNSGSTTNGKFTMFTLDLISATDGVNTINCDNAEWANNPSGSNENTLTCDKIDWYLKVDQKTIKFAVIVSGWPADDESPLKVKVCFTASSLFCKINNGGTYSDCESSNVADDKDKREIKIGGYKFKNEDKATCGGEADNGLDVKYTTTVLDGITNQDTISICYEFAYCASGNIFYDPFVYYEGDNSTDNSTYSTTIATIATTTAATTATINENTNPNINVATMTSFNYYSIFMYMTAVIYYYNQHTI